ncbi:hypothetical protein LZG74_11280 [Dyadobacter sp. CY327]|uniref:hypothetical protein n=1 Tax=Dyadobacter sp. CY327 TaxID=2907301 RepID=UPI001F33CDE9|nr:hypothetical protein [Dyadobacter sp. CY327]MCE7070889.1 hypothetical protein [Dyadobacter sp. CY327]
MKTFWWVILVSWTSLARSQGLTQSADGKSTIPIKGSAVGIDIGKTELSFGYNNLNSAVEAKQIRWIFGSEVRVKNEEGIGNLFSSGDFIPSGNLKGYSGITIDLGTTSEIQRIEKNAQTKFSNWQTSFRTDLKSDFQDFINISAATLSTDALTTTTKTTFTNAMPGANIEEFFDVVKDFKAADPVTQLVYDQIIDFAKLKKKEYTDHKKAYIESRSNLYKRFTATNSSRLTAFGKAGISSIGFKHYVLSDTVNLAKNFEDKVGRGWQFGFGVNYQWRNIWLGFSWSRNKSNNFPKLKKKEYFIKTTKSSGSSSLIEESKLTGYSGTYSKIYLNNIDIDLVVRLKLDNEYKNYTLLNPYLRASVKSSNKTLLQNTVNLGIGIYFLPNNSKLVGGIYFELPDVNNNSEKAKDLVDQNLRPPLRRLTFGVLTKINLSTIMGW